MQRLRELREQSGLTGKEVAVRSGIDMTTIWRWESGRGKTSHGGVELLRNAMADLLNVRISKLADVYDQLMQLETRIEE